ncbi:MAG: hypothetical protein PVJ27_10865, partial [Candidatus Brocadiaceae bacterium]
MDRLIRYAFVLLVTAFFAVMWGLLLLRNLPTEPSTAPMADYSRMLPPDESERESLWDVYFAGRRIGTSTLTVAREEAGTIVLKSETRIVLEPAARYVLGMSGTVDLKFHASISPLRGLRFFQINSDALDAHLIGSVEEGGLKFIGHIGGDRVRTVVPYRGRGFLGNMLSPLPPLRELDEDRVGESWTVEMVNPIAGRVQKVEVSVTGLTEVFVGGESTEALSLLFVTDEGRWTSRVTQEGEVLIQGTPYGLLLKRQDVFLPARPASGAAPPPANPP